MVKLNLECGDKTVDFAGEAVIAIVLNPEGHVANTAAMILGDTSLYRAAKDVGRGFGSIINETGKSTFDKVRLALETMREIRDTIISPEEAKEKKIYEGTMEEFLNGGNI